MDHAPAVGIFPSLLGYRIISPNELYCGKNVGTAVLVIIRTDAIKYLFPYNVWYFDLVVAAEGGAIL